MITRAITYCIFLLMPVVGFGQSIVGVSTAWSDSFREWKVYTSDEYVEGKLYLRWPSRDDWSQWDFRLQDTTAAIQLKWKDDPNLWEVKCMGTIVTARTMWSGDFSQWRLDDGTHQIIWKSKYSNQRDEWLMRELDHGEFTFYTYYERDPREWVVFDELNPEVSFAMRLTMIFIALVHGAPRI